MSRFWKGFMDVIDSDIFGALFACLLISTIFIFFVFFIAIVIARLDNGKWW